MDEFIINMEEQKSPLPLEASETGSSRKRRLSNMQNVWSFSKQTDREILQEMGVSILVQDEEGSSDNDSNQSKSALKRKRGIENVNPNINSASPSPRKYKCSPNKRTSPSPGPSKVRSPDKIDRHELADLTTVEHTLLNDEETPVPQHPVTGYITASQNSDPCTTPRRCLEAANTSFVVSSPEEDAIIQKKFRYNPTGPDAFSVLSDEMMLSIFHWLPKKALVECMAVCKRWHRVASDENFWQRMELGNKLIAKNALGKILARKPVIVRLAGSEIGEWTNMPSTVTETRIQYLDLSMCAIDIKTLNGLIVRCPLLHKLSLEFVNLDDRTCQLIGRCSALETLNLALSRGITPGGLSDLLKGCVRLQSLNISWCKLNTESLMTLVSLVPERLQRLNVAGARNMTDNVVSKLVERCPRLLELDLSDCSRLTSSSIHCVIKLSSLEHVALSRCYLLPPHSLTKLSSMPSLQYLEVWGMLQDASLAALKVALPAIHINQFMLSAVARPTVGTRRTSIWGLKTRD